MANTPSNDTPKKRGGGQPGNKNARGGIRHGLKAGNLPKDAKYIEWRMNAFRRQLEDAVLAKKGEVSMVDAACIQTCLRWERHACLCQRWLTKSAEELKSVELAKFSEGVSKASDARDRALRQLGLDAAPAAPWLCLDVKETTNDQ